MMTAEQVADAIELRKKGLTSTEIAKKLGIKSRNIVIGVLYRRGIKTCTTKKKKKKQEKKKIIKPIVKEVIKIPERPRTQPPEPSSDLNVSLLDRTDDQCSFIVAPQRCCGQPSYQSSSWCEYHAFKVFKPRPE
jgi:hypothetical protein